MALLSGEDLGTAQLHGQVKMRVDQKILERWPLLGLQSHYVKVLFISLSLSLSVTPSISHSSISSLYLQSLNLRASREVLAVSLRNLITQTENHRLKPQHFTHCREWEWESPWVTTERYRIALKAPQRKANYSSWWGIQLPWASRAAHTWSESDKAEVSKSQRQ